MFSNKLDLHYHQERQREIADKYEKNKEEDLKMPLIFSKAMEKFNSKKE